MFTVGEFAGLARVSKRLLRYYDSIGLLKPGHTDSASGYRYYHAEQMTRLNRILVLKDLGLSLDQIRRMLTQEVSAEEMEGMLLLKKAEIEQKLRTEIARIRKIEARLQAIYHTEAEKPLDVVFKQIPAQSVLSVRGVFESFENVWELYKSMDGALPARGGYGVCFTLCQDGEMVERNMHLEVGRMVEATDHAPVPLASGLELSLRQLPAVESMVTTIVTGGLEVIHAGYEQLGLWVESNGYRLAGQPREMTLKMGQCGEGRELVTEIQYPVELVE